MARPSRSGASLDDFWSIPEGQRFHELIRGELVHKASPSGEHGDAQVGVVSAIAPAFRRKVGSGGPGGWWIATEVEVLFDSGDVVRPDVLGWRRESCPQKPSGTPVTTKPDWICQILSLSNPKDDTVKKLRLYHQVAIPYYWIVDPREATLTVMRWSEDGYITLLRAEREETVRAEPFQAIEIAVGSLFGDDPEP